MNSAQVSDVSAAGPGLASWYTPGRSDAFGDRLLMCDNTDASSLELLRFRRELADAPGFDNALRDGIDRVSSIRHAAFPAVRAVVYLDEHDLTLVSAHVSGQRLSQLAKGTRQRPLHPALVTWIVREVTSALAALHAAGPGAAHGALNADRIVFTPDGQLCVVEQALGPAIRRLALSSRALWRDFGLLALADERGKAQIDARNDVAQLGAIALSLLLGQPITLDSFEDKRVLALLLDEFTAMAARRPSAFAAPLRVWLEHALQLAAHPYRSAADAQEGLKELPASGAEFLGFTPESADQGAVMSIHPVRPQQLDQLAPLEKSILPRELAAPLRQPRDIAEPRQWSPRSHDVDERVEAPDTRHANTSDEQPIRKRARIPFVVLGLGLISLVEGGIIAAMAMRPAAAPAASTVVIESPAAGDTVLVDGKPAGTTPLKLAVSSGTRAIRLIPAVVSASIVSTPSVAAASDQAEKDRQALAAITAAAAQQRSGGVRINSPIELKVLGGDRVLGTTADGPIVTTAGTHQLDFMNSALGFRVHQAVTIRAGVLTAMTVTPPMGRLSINAEPWAQVTIDDKPIGDTPLANVAVTLGEHEVLFRHPQLGERRETVVVRADAPARVITSFQR